MQFEIEAYMTLRMWNTWQFLEQNSVNGAKPADFFPGPRVTEWLRVITIYRFFTVSGIVIELIITWYHHHQSQKFTGLVALISRTIDYAQ